MPATQPVGPETDKTVYDRHGFRIVRRVSGYAYPRSGNAHNPTPRYVWLVFKGDAHQGFCRSLAGAKDLLGYYPEAQGK